MAHEGLFYDLVNMFVASLFAITFAEVLKCFFEIYWERREKFASRRNAVQPARYNNYVGPLRAKRSRPQQWTPPPSTNQPIRPFFSASNDYLLSIPQLQQGYRCAQTTYARQ